MFFHDRNTAQDRPIEVGRFAALAHVYISNKLVFNGISAWRHSDTNAIDGQLDKILKNSSECRKLCKNTCLESGPDGVSRREQNITALSQSTGLVYFTVETNKPPFPYSAFTKAAPTSSVFILTYYVFFPFNYSPMNEDLRELVNYDHQGDWIAIAEVLEANGHQFRWIELVMHNHERAIL